MPRHHDGVGGEIPNSMRYRAKEHHAHSRDHAWPTGVAAGTTGGTRVLRGGHGRQAGPVKGWLGKIVRVGRVTDVAASLPAQACRPPTGVRGSLQMRHVDAGSCNGCELEIGGAFSPVYDAERFGARLVASPRHADALLVTGVVTRNMEEPLRNTLAATPEPRVVVAVGDCACNGGVFAGAYGVVGAVDDVVPVDVRIPGCPPTPTQIIDGLRTVTGR